MPRQPVPCMVISNPIPNPLQSWQTGGLWSRGERYSVPGAWTSFGRLRPPTFGLRNWYIMRPDRLSQGFLSFILPKSTPQVKAVWGGRRPADGRRLACFQKQAPSRAADTIFWWRSSRVDVSTGRLRYAPVDGFPPHRPDFSAVEHSHRPRIPLGHALKAKWSKSFSVVRVLWLQAY